MNVIGPLFLIIVAGSFLFCTAIALLTSGLSGKIRHEEDAGIYRSRHPANQN